MDIKQEAINRLELLELDGDVIDKYNRKNILTCYNWLYQKTKIPEKALNAAKEYARTNNCLPYVVSFSETLKGDLYSFLIADNNPEDWTKEKEDLENGTSRAFVYNVEHPEKSSLETIKFDKKNQTIVRTK